MDIFRYIYNLNKNVFDGVNLDMEDWRVVQCFVKSFIGEDLERWNFDFSIFNVYLSLRRF